MKRDIIVIGVTHHNTLSVVRMIGESYSAVDVIIYGEDKSYIAKSKYVRTIRYANDSQHVLQLLIEQKIETTKPIIFSCTDNIAKLLDEHQEELSASYDFFHTYSKGVLTTYLNKHKQIELAHEIGMLTPYSYIYEQKLNWDDFHIQYPCIIKPTSSCQGGKQVYICESPDSLKVKLKVLPQDIPWLIQDKITKKYEIVIAGVSVNHQINIPGYILKRRDFTGGTTYSSIFPLGSAEKQLAQKATAMIKEIGYEGLFGFEFINDGEHYWFIELNLRNDATCYTYYVAGSNLPFMYIMGKINSSTDLSEKDIKTINSIVEFADIPHVFRKELSLRNWVHDWKNAECKYYYNKLDKRPFYCALRKTMFMWLKKIL